MEEYIKLVGSGVDTLMLNVRYSDSQARPIKQELDEKLVQELDYLQEEARRVETAVATDWSFLMCRSSSSHMERASNGAGS